MYWYKYSFHNIKYDTIFMSLNMWQNIVNKSTNMPSMTNITVRNAVVPEDRYLTARCLSELCK